MRKKIKKRNARKRNNVSSDIKDEQESLLVRVLIIILLIPTINIVLPSIVTVDFSSSGL